MKRMNPVRSTLLAALCILAGCSGARVVERSNALPPASPNPGQRAHVLETIAGFRHLGFQVVAARLALGRDTALAWRQLDTLLARPTGDMFWMYPATGLYHTMKDRLDAGWRARFRNAWKTYTPYRGDTENHYLMYYASLLLMSEEWPGLPGSEWFNGRSSQENHDDATEYLEHWIDETVRLGSTEWDSPRYTYYYVTPLILLRDYARDTTLRRRSEMMLELTLADYAAEYLEGSYCGAHSRDADGSVIDPRRAEATSYAQFYFTDSIAFVLPDLAFAALSPWQCPPIIRAIAHDRDTAFVHTETKRSRARLRNYDERYATVFKYDYMTPDYCLGSIQGGLHQPIQQHTWDVTFASPKANNTIFSLHPTWSARELGTFFPEDPELMVADVARAKASYTNENKWIGGSAREQIGQNENVLVAVYDLPRSEPIRHVDLFLPATLDEMRHDTTGWYFTRFGSAFAALRIIADSVESIAETGSTRLRAHVDVTDDSSARALVVVVCGSEREQSFEQFAAAIVADGALSFRNQRLSSDGRSTDSTRRTTLPEMTTWWDMQAPNARGARVTFAWTPGSRRGLVSRVDAATTLASFNGQNVVARRGTAAVLLMAKGHRRLLDFEKVAVSQSAPQPSADE